MKSSEVQKRHPDFVIYETDDKVAKVSVRLEEETVWLTQQQLAELFQSSRTNVVEHIKHIFEEGELSESTTCRKFRQVQKEGNREVSRELPFYNLDMIISLGYRINSKVATRFRQWATHKKFLLVATEDNRQVKRTCKIFLQVQIEGSKIVVRHCGLDPQSPKTKQVA